MKSNQSLDDLVENVNLNQLVLKISKTHYGQEDYIIGLAYYIAAENHFNRNDEKNKIDFMYKLTSLLSKVLERDWLNEIEAWKRQVKGYLKFDTNHKLEEYVRSTGKKIIHAVRTNKNNSASYENLISAMFVPKERLNEILLRQYELTQEEIDNSLN